MNLKRSLYNFIVLNIFLCLSLWSQNKSSNFNFVDINGGISKSGIYSITQDHYGFTWIGTNGAGLYKFDGINHTSYIFNIGDSTSLSNNLVFSTYVDKTNRLWVGTEDGLNLYNRNLDQFIKIPIENSKNKNISVLSLNEDNLDNLFIGTLQNGLFKLNLNTLKVTKVTNLENTLISINSIQKNSQGNIFLGTSDGIKEVDVISNKIIPPRIKFSSALPINYPVQYMTIDNKNNLWVGTFSNGLYKFYFDDASNSLTRFNYFPITTNRILSIIQLTDQTLLVGTENDGLFHINPENSQVKNYRYNKNEKSIISSNSIWSLYLDNNERIWMGYYNNGVAISDNQYDKFGEIESVPREFNSLKYNSVTGIAKRAENQLLIGMDGGGIDLYNTNSNKIEHINKVDTSLYSGLTSDYIQTIFIDSKDNIWAGSWDNGIYVLEKGSREFKNINTQNSNGQLTSNAILSFEEDNSGYIWIGTYYGGLHSYNHKTKKITHYDINYLKKSSISIPPINNVRKILVNKNGVIWLGTTEGLFEVTKREDNKVDIISYSERLAKAYNKNKRSIHILSLFEDSKNYLWIGTRGDGLCRYDRVNDTFKWYNESMGLYQGNIASIIEGDDGNLWVSGNSGISKINLETNEVVNYSSSDGLLSNDFNFNAVLKNTDGTLYFGNYKGIDYFNPKEIKINTSTPSLYLTNLKLFNKEVIPNTENSPLNKVISETDNITLNHKQSVFTIEFTGINYTRPKKNQYAYYLEGLEESWNYVGNLRTATYTNLDYGDYTFMLKAANNDGVWNKIPLKLKITILPPWWRTNFALITYIILFFSGLYLLNKITQIRIKEKEALRAERNKREQDEELNQKRLQFFTNISHEFRTPLTLIINPLQDIIRDTSINLPEFIKAKHRIIYKNTDRLYRLINELIDFRKQELNKMNVRAQELNLVHFTKDIISYFKEEAFSRNLLLTFDADLPNLPIWADESMLEKIIFNILSNAVKVTPDGGAINIEVYSTDQLVNMPLLNNSNPSKVVEIKISDTGPGFEQDQVNRIFERFYQLENLNKTYYGGTGIGLELVQNYVHLHRGKIEVESVVGRGTTFKILFPVGNKHLNENEILVNQSSVNNRNERFILTSNTKENNNVVDKDDSNTIKTLLIVEDNVELRNYLKEELKHKYKILVANNGKEGLILAKETIPDIIITDVIMPEMDGFGFCKLIKSDIKTSHIPLLMLTAKTTIEDRMEGIGYGADAYMVKPFDMRLLELRLAQLITSRKLIFDKYFSNISGSEENANTTSIDKEFIQKLLNYIGENINDSNLSVELLASEFNLSRSQLYRKIKTLTGQTVNQFLRKIRLERAKQILETGSLNIGEVCYKVGFSSQSYFTKCFKAHFGILPTDIEIKEK
jgi:signal transduction histidine kinase/ligand-binding sensor domain-containing protein/DNA-binding response OmpR family regulator